MDYELISPKTPGRAQPRTIVAVIGVFVRLLRLRHAITAILLLLMLVFSILWTRHTEVLVSERVASAEVISVNENDAGNGARMTFATVQLNDGARAIVHISYKTPVTGQSIRVKVREYESGKRNIVAAQEF